MGTPHGGVVSVRIIMMCQVTYIGVGLSALLGWTTRAMREPSKRGPGSRTGSTFFRVYAEEPRTKNICCGSRAELKLLEAISVCSKLFRIIHIAS